LEGRSFCVYRVLSRSALRLLTRRRTRRQKPRTKHPEEKMRRKFRFRNGRNALSSRSGGASGPGAIAAVGVLAAAVFMFFATSGAFF